MTMVIRCRCHCVLKASRVQGLKPRHRSRPRAEAGEDFAVRGAENTIIGCAGLPAVAADRPNAAKSTGGSSHPAPGS